MRTLVFAVAAASLAVPTSFVVAPQQAEAKNHKYKEWRGRDGRRYCRKSDGTTGLVIGGVGGALVGSAVGGGIVGPVVGGVGGALLGKHIDQKNSTKRCR